MAWELLASTVLGSSGDTIDSGTIDAKKFLQIQVFGIADGNLDACVIRCNNDSGSNYAVRKENDGGGSSTNINETGMNYMSANAAQNHYATIFIVNIEDEEKLLLDTTNRDGGSGASNASSRKNLVGKWVNTSDFVTSVQAVNRDGSGDYGAGSYLNVFGSD
jgi:hypothetical protein